MNKKGFVLSTYVYMLLVFFLLLLGTMLVVLNNTKLLSNKLKEGTQESSGLIDKDFSFVLLGDKEVITRVGEEYTDKGFEVKTVKGVDLSEYVITKNDVDTDTIGDYEISYKVTYNGVTKELTRIVHVVDNIGVSYLNTLYQYRKDENGLIIDDTDDENLRYSGSNGDVKNYVEFGNTGELWRIIGVFDVKETESSTAVPRIKLVRNESIGKYSWDSSATDVNAGSGVNEWSEADLNTLLNNTYYNKTTSTTCYNGLNNAYRSCDFTSTGLGSTAKSMITSAVWNTGGVNWSQGAVVKNSYAAERGTVTGKICESDTMYNGAYYCTDEVTRTTSYTDEIGLIYLSDYLYASKDTNCRTKGTNESYYCKNDNWLHTGYHYWLLSPNADSAYSTHSWIANGLGRTGTDHAGYASGVRPSVYLKSNIKITGGTGTETDPYKLSL